MYDAFKEGHVTDCHIVIFQFLLNFWVAIKDKTTKFYFKNLHNFRQIHALFLQIGLSNKTILKVKPFRYVLFGLEI